MVTNELTALDRCDRCGAQAYARYRLASGSELLFCAHHNRKHGDAIAHVAVNIFNGAAKLVTPTP